MQRWEVLCSTNQFSLLIIWIYIDHIDRVLQKHNIVGPSCLQYTDCATEALTPLMRKIVINPFSTRQPLVSSFDLLAFQQNKKDLDGRKVTPPALVAVLLNIKKRERPHQNLFNPLASSALPFFSHVSNLCQNPLGRGERGGSPGAGWLHGRNHGEGKRPQGEGGGNCSCGRRRQPSGQSA